MNGSDSGASIKVSEKKVNSQPVNKIPFPYMTGVAHNGKAANLSLQLFSSSF